MMEEWLKFLQDNYPDYYEDAARSLAHTAATNRKVLEAAEQDYKNLLKRDTKNLNKLIAAEQKLKDIAELQRYGVNQEIGLMGEYPLCPDKTGNWIALGDLQSMLEDK